MAQRPLTDEVGATLSSVPRETDLTRELSRLLIDLAPRSGMHADEIEVLYAQHVLSATPISGAGRRPRGRNRRALYRPPPDRGPAAALCA